MIVRCSYGSEATSATRGRRAEAWCLSPSLRVTNTLARPGSPALTRGARVCASVGEEGGREGGSLIEMESHEFPCGVRNPHRLLLLLLLLLPLTGRGVCETTLVVPRKGT